MSDPDQVSPDHWRPLSEGSALLAPLALAGVAALRWYPSAAPLAFLAAAAAGVAFAFRDPPRDVLVDPAIAFSPADGRVIHMGLVHDEYWDREMLEVGIFLALWDVHVQRVPIAGEIVAQRRKAGGYRRAMTEAATHGNNQFATYLQTASGPCTVTQISGLVARRILTWAAAGDRVAQGDRLGMIKFGSQVTLRVPRTATTLVSVGDGVRAGLSPIFGLAPTEE